MSADVAEAQMSSHDLFDTYAWLVAVIISGAPNECVQLPANNNRLCWYHYTRLKFRSNFRSASRVSTSGSIAVYEFALLSVELNHCRSCCIGKIAVN